MSITMRRRARSAGSAGTGHGPVVPGYELLAPVGFGATGAVWSARDGSGRPVAVSILPLASGERGTAQLRRLGNLRASRHPHLARVDAVVGLDGGRCAVVSEVVTGPSLATVRAARGPLPAGEAATLLVALGAALGHLHERGVIHADVAPTNVLLAPGGVPVLVDLAGEGAHERGTPGFVAPERRRGAAPGAAGDVWALAQLLLWATDGAPDVARLLAPALADDPAARPRARDLAARAPSLAEATAVHLPAQPDLAQAQLRAGVNQVPTQLAVARRPRRRHARPGAWWAASIMVVLAAAGGGAVAWGGAGGAGGPAGLPAGDTEPTPVSGTPPTRLKSPIVVDVGADLPPKATGTAVGTGTGTGTDTSTDIGGRTGNPPEEDLTVVVADLLRRRDAALEAADADALGELTVPGSTAAAADADLLARLRDARVGLEGLRTAVSDVRVVRAAAGGMPARVEVVLRQRVHHRLALHGAGTDDAGPVGAVVVPSRPPRCVALTIEGPAPWRVATAEPCEAGEGGG
ncbi:serine/threonine-protein kinase [Georgenia yuyongxinii]|uniref:serine/threonine-protein kinase n=1 Tax=Georgenia yuyongxinii TaxID=2589797 RepID=UPI00163DA6DE|nr:protein kinase [Georgenia yuyongxinii]